MAHVGNGAAAEEEVGVTPTLCPHVSAVNPQQSPGSVRPPLVGLAAPQVPDDPF